MDASWLVAHAIMASSGTSWVCVKQWVNVVVYDICSGLEQVLVRAMAGCHPCVNEAVKVFKKVEVFVAS